MSAASARQDPELGPLIKDTGLTEWQALVLHLLVERARGSTSRWAPYITSLPDQDQHPLSWSADQLSWLCGSPMLAALRARQQQVVEDTEVLLIAGANDLPVARSHRDATGEDLVSEAAVRWAAATVLSRAFSLDLSAVEEEGQPEEEEEEEVDGEGGEELEDGGDDREEADLRGWSGSGSSSALTLVPWADWLRHSSEADASASVVYDPDIQAARVATHRGYAAGSEVWISFGPALSPPELLLDYGSVGDVEAARANAGGQHKFEADALEVVPPRSRRNAVLLAALRSAQGGGPGGLVLALSPSGPDITALTYGRAALASDAELVRAGWRVKATDEDGALACRVMGRLSQPINAANEAAVLRAFIEYVDRRLEAYPKEPPSSPDGLRQQVWVALSSEADSLVGSRAVLQSWRDQLASGVPVEELYQGMFDEEEEEDG